MKQPLNPLPWTQVTDPLFGSHEIRAANGRRVLNDKDFYPDSVDEKDQDYITQAANLLPDAVEIMVEIYQTLEDAPAPLRVKISQFMSRLENE